MKLSDIVLQLGMAELKSLYIDGDGLGGIPTTQYPAIISSINMCLSDLHTRFLLKQKEVVVQQVANVSMYPLLTDHAVSNTSSAATKFIVDSIADPFIEDIILIESIYDELGQEYPLNNEATDNSLYTPAYNTLQVPEPEEENALFITYRADHPRIPLDTVNLATVNVDLPNVLLSALLAYVAGRMHGTAITEGSIAASMKYNTAYETICTQMDMRNLLDNPDNYSNNKLENNSWA